ncbi:hypothetical protein PHLCEN_2v8351 [Hermanssonia centrifuga]|uniref:Uncharacterized protein n=1 Tax=Hermanssonia centrifuga TaxID=98765 RepID=A0A2R6NTW8_9APHY|nr:hypothetical protein PHLCEN_2v8351 [Hermanssonia centrifuga]
MGTRGYKVYRHKRWYFAYYKPYDSYPEGLGVDFLTSVPTDPDKFQMWLNQYRADFDNLLVEREELLARAEDFDDPEEEIEEQLGVLITREQPMNEWVYECDLDRLIFHVDHMPMYPLDHMPPEDIFLASIDTDLYGHRKCSQMTPEEYKFTPESIPPPPVEDLSLLTFRNQPNASTPILPHELLGIAQMPSLVDIVCIRATEVNIGVCLYGWGCTIAQEVMLASPREELSDIAVAMSLSLASIALLPIHLFSEGNPLTVERKQPDSFYWMRRHICLTLVTHLQHERNLEAAVSELVDEISKKSEAQGIVFGVAFSVLHCVLVRVDKTAGGSWRHSGALQFLPSFSATSPDTPGITALVRLRNLPAKDDIQFFHALLSSVPAVDSRPSEDKTIQRPTKLEILSLAPEILDQIIAEIEEPADLRSLALTSTGIMCAVIPHLQHPQVNVNVCEGLILRAVYPAVSDRERQEAQHLRENVQDQNKIKDEEENDPAAKVLSASFVTTYQGKRCVCDVGKLYRLFSPLAASRTQVQSEDTEIPIVQAPDLRPPGFIYRVHISKV